MAMDAPTEVNPLALGLVGGDVHVQAVVRLGIEPEHTLALFSLTDLVDRWGTLSTAGRKLIEEAQHLDAILVAWDLELSPVINTLCYHVRREAFKPVIGLCRSGQDEAVAALAAGADDALTFPLHIGLLRARILAYHRIVNTARQMAGTGGPAGERSPDVRQLGPLRVDRAAHRAWVREAPLDLTMREFTLLDYLIERAGHVCTRGQILDRVWGLSFDTGTNMVDVYMYFLRRKLEAHGVQGLIQTVRGRGYRLSEET